MARGAGGREMKKIAVLMLAAAIACALCGCGGAQVVVRHTGLPSTIPVPSGYVPDERVPYEVVYGDDGVDVILHFLREAEE